MFYLKKIHNSPKLSVLERMLSTDLLSKSPVRKLNFPIDVSQAFRPYGGSTAFNILEYFLGTPEVVTKVNADSIMQILIFSTNLTHFFGSGLVLRHRRLEKCFADGISVLQCLS